ncbi:zinc finger protein, putative [Plasmodium reichenowi]|uniref:Zinc finger protein, putative n=1 Tax=Plasmodium reichenowi TaxID=5854 RepID=A0A060RWI2_PLARE|nr:zinc finger protein, putative [Plasmodium reichenowi]KYN95528.1 zinc finger protein, putative [Plasmodium reichenowi]CDO65705.1 zinc finger protein, putative [Plasmodium reichenowi]SOV80865.1 zinc finger protein, putative [Plasmodium reichenowi]
MSKKRKSYENDEDVYDNKRNKKNVASSIDSYGRKVWDKEYYQKKVDEKVENDEDELILKLLPDLKKKSKLEPPPPSERKLLEERKENLLLEKNLGKVQFLTEKTPKNEQGGYYCKICDCVLKDSQTYLDHINGKNHNRMLGYSMKVKKVTLDDVKKRLSLLKEKKQNKTEDVEKDPYEEAKKNLKDMQEDEERRIQKRKEKKMLKKLEKEKKKNENENKNENKNDDEESDNMNMMFKEMGLPTSFV